MKDSTTWMNLQKITVSAKASPNRLYCIYGSIYITFLKLQSCRNGKQISGCQMLGWGKSAAIKGHPEYPSGDGNVLYLDFININTLLLILHYNFPVCHHWGQLSKAYMRSFFIISYN